MERGREGEDHLEEVEGEEGLEDVRRGGRAVAHHSRGHVQDQGVEPAHHMQNQEVELSCAELRGRAVMCRIRG